MDFFFLKSASPPTVKLSFSIENVKRGVAIRYWNFSEKLAKKLMLRAFFFPLEALLDAGERHERGRNYAVAWWHPPSHSLGILRGDDECLGRASKQKFESDEKLFETSEGAAASQG